MIVKVRRANLRWLVLAGLALGGLALATPAAAQVYYTVRQLLADQFAQSRQVTFVKARLSNAQKADVERKLGRPLPKNEYTFYVAKTGGVVDGYALFDEEKGEHEMIGFATFFDANGRVTRCEVVAYREAYGDEIRRERFRRQFLGKHAGSGFRVGKDIDAVTGATISSESMSRAVRRAAVLLDKAVLTEQE